MGYLFGLTADEAIRIYNATGLNGEKTTLCEMNSEVSRQDGVIVYEGSVNKKIQAFYDERIKNEVAVFSTENEREFILRELDKLEAQPTEPEYNHGNPDDVYSQDMTDDELPKSGREIILALSKRVAELEESKKRQDAVAHHYHSLWISERERADHNQKGLENANKRAKELDELVLCYKSILKTKDEEAIKLMTIAQQAIATVHRQAQSLPIHTPKADNQPPRKK
jgi:hypothetical protein